MQFVNPLFLFGLLAVAIPVIIHLFNFRRFRKVYFTNVKYLKELKQETRKQSKLRHLIILALRILAIAALVTAFSQPYIPASEERSKVSAFNTVSIYVDNSFSMEAGSVEGSLLDEAINKAREIVKAYKPSDRFHLLTNDFEGRHQRLVTADEFLNMLSEVKVSPAVRTLPEIVNRQADALAMQPSATGSAYIISDFQKSVFAHAGGMNNAKIATWLLPLTANNVSNVFIDSCWFELPLQQAGQSSVLNVKIDNKSESDLEKVPVKLEINGTQKGVASVDIRAGSSTTTKIPFTNYESGIQQGVIRITDYPVVYDDDYYFSFEVSSAISVLCINGSEPNRYLNALFSHDSLVNFRNVSQKAIDYGTLNNYNLLIFNEVQDVSSGLGQEVKRYLENGGTLAIVPSPKIELESFNKFLAAVNAPSYQLWDTASSPVTRLSLQNPVFRDVFEKSPGAGEGLPANTMLPVARRYLPISSASQTAAIPLISLLNNKVFLTVSSGSQGQVYQFAVPFDPAYSNFPQQALFVPVLYNIALMSRQLQEIAYTIGDNKPARLRYTPSGKDDVYRVVSASGNFECIPQYRQEGNSTNIFVNGQLTTAGNYVLKMKELSLMGLAYNYNRSESDPECLSQEELKELINKNRLSTFAIIKNTVKPLNEVIAEMNFGKRLWKYFVWAALLFLLAEVVLLRIWNE